MSNIQQLQQEINQLKQRNDQLQRELNEANRKIVQKEETIKAIDAENRRNVAKIGKLESENNRLTQAANRAVCQRCTMRSN
jgi:uncharacterized coiled-coil DUF342 family protein